MDPRDAMRAGELAEADMRRMGLSEVYERRNWVWFARQE